MIGARDRIIPSPFRPSIVTRGSVALALAVVLWPAIGGSWIRLVPDTVRDVDLESVDLAVDSGGNAFVATVTADPDAAHVSALVVKLTSETGVESWRTKIGAESFPSAIAIDPTDGNVLLGSQFMVGTVTKLASSDGAIVWASALGRGSPFVIATFAGQIIVGGSLGSDGVVALSPADGAQRWRGAGGMGVNGLATGADGAIVAVGVVGSRQFSDLAVMKLDAGGGTERWRHTINGSFTSVDGTSISWDVGTGVAVDPHGDVIATGWTQNEIDDGPTDIDFVVEKLSGASGATIWRHDLAGPDRSDDRGATVTVDAAGDIFAVGWLASEDPDRAYTVFKISGETGTVLWSSRLSGPTGDGFASRIALAGSDVLVAGDLSVDGDPQFAIARLAGATGEPIWIRTIDGAGPERPESYDGDRARRLGIDRLGRVVVAGFTKNAPELEETADVTVVQFADRLAGARLMIRERHRRRGTERLVIEVRDRSLLSSSGRGADPTIDGAVMELSNPSTGDLARIALPAAGWSRGKRRALGVRYKYADPGGRAGPCRSAVIESGKRFAVRCKGSLGFPLDRPQGTLIVRVVVADAGVSYCARFGGSVTRDQPTTADADGIFEARNAPAPEACP
jgi:outer membrane protein assembly factor BamB